MNFNQRVYALVRQVPRGKVVCYGDVAAAMGSPRAARQVGRALAALGWVEPGEPVPWQRVIKLDGQLPGVGDPGHWSRWRDLLAREGVVLVGDRVPMVAYRWRPEPGQWLDPALDLDGEEE